MRSSLAAAEVRFVVAGGVAVVLHGHPRLTADLDLVVDLAPDQIARALDVLTELGLRPAVPVDVHGIDDLIAMKRAADRPRDRADIAALEALRDG